MSGDPAPRPQLGLVGLLLLVIVPFGLGYFLSFFFRNINGVLAPELMAAFGLGASEIGILTSGYFFAAALQMIPLALLLDRFGPRRVLIAQMAMTTLACVVSSRADSFAMVAGGRLLFGLGVAGCLPTAFKAITVWLPRDRLATANGVVLFIGSFGALAATRPLQIFVDLVGWREMFMVLAMVSAGLGLVALLIVPEANAPRRQERRSNAAVYREILRHPVFLRVAPGASLALAVFFAIQGLWANGWMSDVAGLDQSQIGERLLAMALAMAIGMLLNGAIGDELARRGLEFAAYMAVGLACFVATLLMLVFELAPGAIWPWVVLGFTGNIGSLVHPILYRCYAMAYAARVLSTVSVIALVLIFAVQTGIGLILDLWGADEAGRYPAIAYRWGFGLLAALEVVLLVWFVRALPLLRGSRIGETEAS